MQNLNRKIKIIAIKVKKTLPEKTTLMEKIQQQIKHEDIAKLVRLISKSIGNISKDVAYSSKLISQFEKEMERLKVIVENLKKTIEKNKKISQETAKKITKPWYDTINYAEKQIHNDLKIIFRNIFVEYKYVATRSV